MAAGPGLVPSPLGDAAGDAGFVGGALTGKRTEKEIVAGPTSDAAQPLAAKPHEERLGEGFDMTRRETTVPGVGRRKSNPELHISLDTYY